MTNEEMAVAIQQGNTDLISPLWEQMQQFLYMLAGRYYAGHKERAACCGLTENDFKQTAFFVLLDMVKAYDPEAGYKLTAYAKYQCMNHFNALLGFRTSKVINEPLNNCVSLDEPISTDAEDTRGRIIPDRDSEKPFDDAINDVWRQQLRAAEEAVIDTLEAKRAQIIRKKYFEGRTDASIAEEMNLSEGRVYDLRTNALRKLKQGKSALILRPFCDSVYQSLGLRHTGISAFRSCGSATERAVETLEDWANRKRFEST